MADRKKFEEMLERLINEDREGAEELFHQLVVEKSREIYENLLEDDADIEESDDEEVDETADEDSEDEVAEASDEDTDEETNEDFNLDEFEVEADPMADMGGDPADDMMADLEGGDDEEDDGAEGDMEDRVEDLEDALEDLKAEFEKLMAGEEGEEEHGDMDMGDMGDEEGEDEGDEEKEAFNFGEAEEDDEEDEVEETKSTTKSSAEQMREYVEKVNGGFGAKIGGDNGQNTKSPVASKNDMGGTASNLNQAGTEAGVEANKGNLKGSSLSGQNAKEDNAGNVNVPGGKASKSMKAMPKGHGAEKKGAGETAANKTSIIGK